MLQDDDAPDGCHHESCVAEAEFIVPHFHLFTEFFILSEEVFDYEKEYQLLAEIEYGEPVTFYKSAEIHSFHGLRAPPLLSYL